MWILVYISIVSGVAQAETVDSFEDLNTCFKAREALSLIAGGQIGYFPTGSQAVCINDL